MLKELLHIVIECGKNMDPIEVVELLATQEYKSDIEMFENTDCD